MSKIVKLFSIALLIGVLAGTLSSAFLYALKFVTELRLSHPALIFGLPVFGLVFFLIIKKVPKHINQGVPYILEELDHPAAIISPWMAPFIFFASVGTHLFGGSAGREGVGVIMGASMAHVIPNVGRSYLVFGGMAAGFASIFGTPLAAVVFAFELHHFRHRRDPHLILITLISAFMANFVTHLLGPEHARYVVSLNWQGDLVFYVLIGILASGLGGQIFYWGLKFYPKLKLNLVTGGLLVTLVIYFFHAQAYSGIGTQLLAESFVAPKTVYDFLMKCLLTIMTIAVGFKGGEVTPLFIMGATLSNSLCSLVGLTTYSLSSALGMVGLFGAVSATPVASAIMGAELFGYETFPLCLAVCLVGRMLLFNRSVYRH